VDLETDPRNIEVLINHRSRHSEAYHKEIEARMNKALERLGNNKDRFVANEALGRIMQGIRKDIASGKLEIYNNRDVWLVPGPKK
jgi:hypothetical protein